jgi:transcriptional regulator with XRE-family HTH domain
MPRKGPRRTSDIKRRLGETIRSLREERVLTQAELSRRSGTSRSEINGLENGSRAITVITLESVARALGVPISTLFADEKRPATPSRSEATLYRIVGKLRDREPDYLLSVEKIIDFFDRETKKASKRR